MKDARYYQIISSTLRENLMAMAPINEIKPVDPRDDLSFEIEGIAHELDKCKSSHELSELIARTFNRSFEKNLSASDFSNISVIIFKELRSKGIDVGENI